MLRPLVTTDVAHLQTFALVEPDLWKNLALSAAGNEGIHAYVQAALTGHAAQKGIPVYSF